MLFDYPFQFGADLCIELFTLNAQVASHLLMQFEDVHIGTF